MAHNRLLPRARPRVGKVWPASEVFVAPASLAKIVCHKIRVWNVDLRQK